MQRHQAQVYSGGCSSLGLSEVHVVVMHDKCIQERVLVSACACACVCWGGGGGGGGGV